MEVFLLFVLLLAGQQISCFAASLDGGFSVEFIHRDSPRSPFYDPTLSPQDRMLAAVRRSLAYGRGSAKLAAPPGNGIVAEIVPWTTEYLMYVNVGTPLPRKILVIADTGSDLIWVNCRQGGGDLHRRSAASVDDDSPPSDVVFDPSQSSTYHFVDCHSDECKPLGELASCDGGSNCQYKYSYSDYSQTVGLLSTETFTFLHDRDGSVQPMSLANIRFGCSMYTSGWFAANGIVGLGSGTLSLVSQLRGAAASFGSRFSYCLVPHSSYNVSSTLYFGAMAVVSDPGAVSTPLVSVDGQTYYTVELESISIGGQTVAQKTCRIIVDSGTTLTFLDSELFQPLVSELERQIKLPRMQGPDQKHTWSCYNVSGLNSTDWGIPDVTLQFGGGAAVTLRPENSFFLVQQGTLCLAVLPASEMRSLSILGNVAQQDFHVGYDLEARTVTFAAADCAKSSSSAS